MKGIISGPSRNNCLVWVVGEIWKTNGEGLAWREAQRKTQSLSARRCDPLVVNGKRNLKKRFFKGRSRVRVSQPVTDDASAFHIWKAISDSARWRHSASDLTARETGALVGTGRDLSFPQSHSRGYRICTRGAYKHDHFDHCRRTEHAQVSSKSDAKIRLQSKIRYKAPSSQSCSGRSV